MPPITEGAIVWGLQLPVQTLTESIREAWEPDAGVDDLLAVAQHVDRAGGFFVSVCDHIAIPDNAYARRMGPTWYDPIATLGFVAAATTNVRLVSSVFIAPYRHPLLSAKQFMTLDRLSGGRVIAGVGAGHVEAEFDALGVDFAQRGRLLDEAIDAMRESFAHETAQFSGEFFEYKDMQQRPRPVQDRIPIWIGGSSKPAMRRVAERGDGWIPQGTPRDQMPAALDYMRAHRDRVRPGAPLDFGFYAEYLYVGEPFFPRDLPRHVCGAPEVIAESLRFARDIGCSHLHLHFRSRTRAELCDQIDAFSRDVWPLVTA